MQYTDTRDSSVNLTFKDAVMKGMSVKSGGLYVPKIYPSFDPAFLNRTPEPCFRDIAFETAKMYTDGEIPENDLESIIVDAYPFSPKIVPIDPVSYVLELFHGPTCAFKDFGARFMARVMSYFNRGENEPLHILVATSGDTGSAVGSAFHNVPGLDVTILYPAGKISPLQEKQLSTFTGNVRALKVEGTFDDCQKLVKTAFTDDVLRKKFRLSSANSINISRLLPQSFYYTYASLVVKNRIAHDSKIESPAIIFSVPSGNFGNLTSGFIAAKMGAPITGFIAATNENKTVPDWKATGSYSPRPSIQTYSNAMDVGAPSNFERMTSLFEDGMSKDMLATYWVDNKGTIDAIAQCNLRTGYIIDPHGAIAWQAWDDTRRTAMKNLTNGIENSYDQPGLTPKLPLWADQIIDKKGVGIILETAHPAKFGSIVNDAIGREPSIPNRLEKIMSLPDRSIPMNADYNQFKEWLLANL